MEENQLALPIIPFYRLGPEPTWTNRTSWRLDPARALLLVHDMQNHFVRAFDRAPESQIETAIDEIAALLRTCRRVEVPVAYTAQPPGQAPEDRGLLTDFWGPGMTTRDSARIVEELAPREDDVVLTKWRYSAFYRSDLEHRMRNAGRDQLVITGVYSHIGCLTTALIAFMHGFQVFFVADAQADFSPERHRMAVDYVASCCGQACTSRDVDAALSGQRALDEGVVS